MPMPSGRGRYPMENPPASDSSITPAPALPRRAPVDADLPRFSATTASARETIDSFCRASRPWALRQAKRTYRHLPESLREQAVDRAYAELRTRTPASTERRVLSAELAERVTEALRHVHVGWCLNESSALLRREGTEPVQPEVRREELARFVDSGLGGLERAVLQLEIGAGRDTRSARAALRLHPRAYQQHREAGFSKLRDAISAQVIGRACDQHVTGVVAAAIGDRSAMDELANGTQRCRSCAREAQGLRSVLHERLAVAPWPLVIKPAGLVAAKLGAVGAVLGGKSAAGGGAVIATAGSGSGASMAASVLAVAALATGTAAIVGHDATPRERVAGHSAPAALANSSAAPTAKLRTISTGGPAKAAPRTRAAKARAHIARRKHTGGGTAGGATGSQAGGAPATTSSATTVAATSNGSGGGTSGGTVGSATKPVTGAVDDTVQQVTSQLPAAVGSPVQGVVDGATDAVDSVTDTVDGVLPTPTP